MVAVGIVFLFGLLGLVVDVGWGYYRKQVAQAAADAAALGAVMAAGTGTLTCGSGGIVCSPSGTSCSSVSRGNGFGKRVANTVCKTASPNSAITMASDLTQFQHPVSRHFDQLLGESHGDGKLTGDLHAGAGLLHRKRRGDRDGGRSPGWKWRRMRVHSRYDRHQVAVADRIRRSGVGLRRLGEIERPQGDLSNCERRH